MGMGMGMGIVLLILNTTINKIKSILWALFPIPFKI